MVTATDDAAYNSTDDDEDEDWNTYFNPVADAFLGGVRGNEASGFIVVGFA
jgi:hypothetical protein